jgi:hypothetical protein
MAHPSADCSGAAIEENNEEACEVKTAIRTRSPGHNEPFSSVDSFDNFADGLLLLHGDWL